VHSHVHSEYKLLVGVDHKCAKFIGKKHSFIRSVAHSLANILSLNISTKYQINMHYYNILCIYLLASVS